MKFTLSWLKSHLETEASLDHILKGLTAVGLEVEGVKDAAADLAAFTVGYVTEAKRHPNADKLQVCMVDTGTEIVQVVCGAPNARAGMKGVFAKAGTVIPRTGALLKKGVIRGEESNGMLCSAYEMGISEDHDGIIDLPDDAPLGRPFAQVMGLDDPMIEIAVTPNRADALGVRGVARDLAAAGLGVLKPLDLPKVSGSFKSPVGVTLDLGEAVTANPLFIGRYIRGVKNGPSPDWLQQRLTSIGLRPISILVDITNLLTFDLDRPLHVFDAGKLKGSLRVHIAKGGESLEALNGKTYKLEPGMIAISDDSGVVSLAGVMGSASTGCDESTTDLFLEAAYFDPLRVARTGRALGILSDARYRNERGIDPAFTEPGAEIATKLILELCGGDASELVIAGSVPDTTRHLPFRPARVASLGGVAVPEIDCRRILTALGFKVEGKAGDETLTVTPPSWRADIEGEADLVEEVLRIYGYDHIPAVSMERGDALPKPALSPRQQRDRRLRRLLAGRGLVEAVTWSFMGKPEAEAFAGGQAELALANPISSDLDQMRPTPLPNLLAAAARNRARGIDDVALFEVGPGYVSDQPNGQLALAVGLRVGRTLDRHWRGSGRPVDLFDAKADLAAAFELFGLNAESMPIAREAPDWYHPGRSGVIKLGPKTLLARFGEVHPAVLKRYDIDAPAVAFEIFLDAVPLPKAKDGRARPLLKPSPFQPVVRDFAFLLPREASAETVLKAARQADRALITDVSVFDLYEGKGLEPGTKSLAISVTLQPTDHTLTDAEIEAVGEKVVAAVAKASGGSLRR